MPMLNQNQTKKPALLAASTESCAGRKKSKETSKESFLQPASQKPGKQGREQWKKKGREQGSKEIQDARKEADANPEKFKQPKHKKAAY